MTLRSSFARTHTMFLICALRFVIEERNQQVDDQRNRLFLSTYLGAINNWKKRKNQDWESQRKKIDYTPPKKSWKTTGFFFAPFIVLIRIPKFDRCDLNILLLSRHKKPEEENNKFDLRFINFQKKLILILENIRC